MGRGAWRARAFYGGGGRGNGVFVKGKRRISWNELTARPTPLARAAVRGNWPWLPLASAPAAFPRPIMRAVIAPHGRSD